MIEEQFTLKNKFGLHTRAAAKLVDIAKKYASHIELSYKDQIVDCKSIMGVITLGAPFGGTIQIILKGEDEEAAFNAIQKLIDDKFGEE